MNECNKCIHEAVCDQSSRQMWARMGGEAECSDFKDREKYAEVRRGEWAHLGGDEWCCTSCGNVIYTEGSWEKPTKKYCHECGAKMDAEVSE